MNKPIPKLSKVIHKKSTGRPLFWRRDELINIERFVEGQCGFSKEQLMPRNRQSEYVAARAIYVYLLSSRLDMSVSQIARFFERDRSMVTGALLHIHDDKLAEEVDRQYQKFIKK